MKNEIQGTGVNYFSFHQEAKNHFQNIIVHLPEKFIYVTEGKSLTLDSLISLFECLWTSMITVG